MDARTLVCLHGVGGSPQEWAPAARALDGLARIVTEMPAEGGVIMVGHSQGAVRALELSQSHPRRVEAVVLTNGFFPPARGSRTMAGAAWDYGRHRVQYLREVASRGRAPHPTGAGARQLVSLARLGLRPARFHVLAASVRCPVLVVHGDQDHVVPVAFARAAAASHLTWQYREIRDGGHFLHRDRPTEWAAIVERWLAGAV